MGELSLTRLITAEEAEILRRALECASVRPIPASLLESIGRLIVVSECVCGCGSVEFGSGLTGSETMIVDGVGILPVESRFISSFGQQTTASFI